MSQAELTGKYADWELLSKGICDGCLLREQTDRDAPGKIH